MTNEELERAIDFLTNQQAKNSRDILSTRESVNKLSASFAETREQLDARRLETLATEASRQASTERMDSDRLQIREAMSRLLIANEVTRDLAKQVAKELAKYD